MDESKAGVDLSADLIRVVIELLDFKRETKVDNNSIMTLETHLLGPDRVYPAIETLYGLINDR